MSETIRLFVGTSAANEDLEAQSVYEFSARKYCSQPLEITWMRQAKDGPWSGWKCATGRTPFSHFRFSIPAACDFKGKGIYSDLDFIWRADLAELWNQPVPGVLLAKRGKKADGKIKTCCMLFDCGKARGHVPGFDKLRQMGDVIGHMAEYFRVNSSLATNYAGDWNAIDLKGYDDINDPRIKAVHYSRIEVQLHLKYAIPRLAKEGQSHWYQGPVGTHWRPELVALFDGLLVEAIAAGYPPEKYRVDPMASYEKRNFVYSTHKGAA